MPWTKFRPIAYVNTLPATPVDGQEVFYQSTARNTGGGREVSMKDAGIVWRLRYNASGDRNYPWEFIGGSPVRTAFTPSTPRHYPAQYTYYTFANSTPVYIPLAGHYEMQTSFSSITASVSNSFLMYYGAIRAASTTQIGKTTYAMLTPWNFFGAYFVHRAHTRVEPLVSLATPTVIEPVSWAFNNYGAGAWVETQDVSLTMRPIRVGRVD